MSGPRIHRIHVSDGGVPKHPVPACEVRRGGIVGDRQRHPAVHGGPHRAVCLLGLDVIEALRAEGHPIGPGATGENLTLAGLSWARLVPGGRLRFAGGVVLEIAGSARPCPAIRAAFTDGRIEALDARRHPGRARLYARVLVPGRLETGEALALEVSGAPVGPAWPPG